MSMNYHSCEQCDMFYDKVVDSKLNPLKTIKIEQLSILILSDT